MNKSKLESLLKTHVGRIERKIAIREKLNKRLSAIRLMYFLIACVGIFSSLDYLNNFWAIVSISGSIIGFLVLITLHRRVYQSQEKFEHLRDIKEQQIARMNLDWAQIPYRPVSVDFKGHPYANDLNVHGIHSVHHLIDTSIYEGSAKVLMEWLTVQKPDEKEVQYRQKLVRELTPLAGFRDKLGVIGKFTQMRTSSKDWSIEDMFAWLRLPKREGIGKLLLILGTLSILNISLGLLTLFSGLNPIFLIVTFVSYLIIYKLYDHKVSGLFDAAFQIETILARLSAILLHIEKFKVKEESGLKKLLKPIQVHEESPSMYIRKAQKLMGAASLQKNEIWGTVLNAVVPWNVYFVWRLEALKPDLNERLTKWMETFYVLEALNSLANFAMLNPGYCWPEFESNSSSELNAEELGHPLIRGQSRVSNDFKVFPGKELFLITGSNMSGKSTFLRTLGVNLILAYAGAPVCAKSFDSGFFRLFSSINVNDSLDDGISHFYAEVKRLREMLDALNAEDELPLFFFVDEIYKGTNNRERYAGSAAFLKEVAGKNGVGMVSTHDLELADLDTEIKQLTNWHFVESIKDGKMDFEYKLKPGPCPSTNALEIMRREGLPT